MQGVLVDTCVLLDLFTNNPDWAHWSENTLEKFSQTNTLYINSIIYAEASVGFRRIEALDAAVDILAVKVLEMPREALFLAGKAFLQYKLNQGTRKSLLADFFIGAHAAVLQFGLMTRDTARYKTYFPQVQLICP